MTSTAFIVSTPHKPPYLNRRRPGLRIAVRHGRAHVRRQPRHAVTAQRSLVRVALGDEQDPARGPDTPSRPDTRRRRRGRRSAPRRPCRAHSRARARSRQTNTTTGAARPRGPYLRVCTDQPEESGRSARACRPHGRWAGDRRARPADRSRHPALRALAPREAPPTPPPCTPPLPTRSLSTTSLSRQTPHRTAVHLGTLTHPPASSTSLGAHRLEALHLHPLARGVGAQELVWRAPPGQAQVAGPQRDAPLGARARRAGTAPTRARRAAPAERSRGHAPAQAPSRPRARRGAPGAAAALAWPAGTVRTPRVAQTARTVRPPAPRPAGRAACRLGLALARGRQPAVVSGRQDPRRRSCSTSARRPRRGDGTESARSSPASDRRLSRRWVVVTARAALKRRWICVVSTCPRLATSIRISRSSGSGSSARACGTRRAQRTLCAPSSSTSSR